MTKAILSLLPTVFPIIWCLGYFNINGVLSGVLIVIFALAVFLFPPAALIIEAGVWILSGYIAFTAFLPWAIALWVGLFFLRFFFAVFFFSPPEARANRRRDPLVILPGVFAFVAFVFALGFYFAERGLL